MRGLVACVRNLLTCIRNSSPNSSLINYHLRRIIYSAICRLVYELQGSFALITLSDAVSRIDYIGNTAVYCQIVVVAKYRGVIVVRIIMIMVYLERLFDAV